MLTLVTNSETALGNLKPNNRNTLFSRHIHIFIGQIATWEGWQSQFIMNLVLIIDSWAKCNLTTASDAACSISTGVVSQCFPCKVC